MNKVIAFTRTPNLKITRTDLGNSQVILNGKVAATFPDGKSARTWARRHYPKAWQNRAERIRKDPKSD